jgi:plasmid stability protein
MATITVDDTLLALLRVDATSHGVSPDTRAEDILREVLDPRAKRKKLFEEAQRISAMTPKGVKQTPAEVLIREDRDR